MEEFNTQQTLLNSLREIKTPFGIIYIEQWGENAEREDRFRITIYDSKKDYLDYFSLDYFYDGFDPEYDYCPDYETEEEAREDFARTAYYDLCDMLEKGGEMKTCEEFMDWLGLNYVYVGSDKAKAADALSDGHPEELLPDEIETNEYVNHIGDYYIVVDY